MLPWNELLSLNPAGWCSDIPATIGPYKLSRRLNEDPLVQVFDAFHEGYARGVQLEMIDPAAAGQSKEAISAKAAAWLRIRHKNLFSPIDIGEYDDMVYLAFERIPGGTLAAGVDHARQQERTLPISQIIHVGTSIGQAILHLHEHGRKHGCVSPGAVVFSLDGNWMLANLESGLLGLPVPFPFGDQEHYLPPDSSVSGGCDDAYAYAVILAEMLLNLPPRIAARTIAGQHYATTPALHAIPEKLFDALHTALNPRHSRGTMDIEQVLGALCSSFFGQPGQDAGPPCSGSS